MTVVVHAADIQDRDGADWVLEAAQRKSSRLTHVRADGGYSGDLAEWCDAERGITIEIVGKRPGQTIFVVSPRRWVVERTLANLGRARRLAEDYEREDVYRGGADLSRLDCLTAPSSGPQRRHRDSLPHHRSFCLNFQNALSGVGIIEWDKS